MTPKIATVSVALLFLACAPPRGLLQAQAAAGLEPCPDRIQPGRWVKMREVPVPTDPAAYPVDPNFWPSSFRTGERVLTLLTVEPPTGLFYDLCADQWAPMDTRGAPPRSLLRHWTGTELVFAPDATPGSPVMGFDPRENRWSSRGSLPPGRFLALEWWTHEPRVLVFQRDSTPMGDFGPGPGSLWELATARMTPLAGQPPSPRNSYAHAWLGDRFIAWGGAAEPPRPPLTPSPSPSTFLGDGAVLERRDGAWAWKPTSSKGAPSPRAPGVFARSGSRLVVWGGHGPAAGPRANCLADGGVYDADRDEWRAIPSEGAPSSRTGALAIVNGKWFAVLGGYSCGAMGAFRDDGAVYDLEAGTWRAVTLPGAVGHNEMELAALEDGRIAIVPPSGRALGNWLGILDPRTAQVTRVDIPEQLRGRRGAQLVATGRRLLVFGGYRDLWDPNAGSITESTPDGMIYGF